MPSFIPKKQAEKLRVGAHVVTITGFEFKKEGGSIVYFPGTNNPQAITVTFTNGAGVSKRKNFSLAENSVWVLENLSNIIGVDLFNPEKEYDVDTEIIGRRLVIVICRIFLTKGNVVITENGRQKFYDDVSPNFYKEEDILLVKGDPSANPPTGDFIRYREEWKQDK
jgi:hypothetical protein